VPIDNLALDAIALAIGQAGALGHGAAFPPGGEETLRLLAPNLRRR